MRERRTCRELLLVAAGIVIVFLRLYGNRHGVCRTSSHIYKWSSAACAGCNGTVLSEGYTPGIRSILDYCTVTELDSKLKLIVACASYVDRLN